ncbi:hypothetical protein [Actinokineospora sp. NPDC004072]
MSTTLPLGVEQMKRNKSFVSTKPVVAAAIAGVVLCTAGTAQADTRPPEIKVSPSALAPGQPLTVSIYCLGQNIPWDPQARSAGFASPVELRHVGDGGTGIGTALEGSGHATATPGAYTAAYDCNGWPVKTTFTVS